MSKLLNKITRRFHWTLIPWCWLCWKLDRCDWCFHPITHEVNNPDWEWCEKCKWGPGLPSRWEV